MTNTLPANEIKPTRSKEYLIPKWYMYWEVQSNEDNFSEEEITKLQQQLLASILVSWDIQIFQVVETERLQKIKLSRNPVFNRDLQSVALTDIAEWSDIDEVVWNLEKIWAQSTLFERYAWSRWGYSRNNAQWNFILQTQTCRI